jgi:hypothetical protein
MEGAVFVKLFKKICCPLGARSGQASTDVDQVIGGGSVPAMPSAD